MSADQAIFLRTGDGLTPLQQQPFANEPILQKALADYPDLIAGVATTGEAGRLLLVRREMPVPGATGAGHLSLDHLFVDSAGVPVLVEVKRSSDTRARREVVAQMLDYAANAVAYWPVERLRALVDEAAARKDLDQAALLQQELGVDDEPDKFWRLVEDNLRAGRVRLIFLADKLTPELVRIIEFLNEQMRDTEVLSIELPQYTGAGDTVVYVPRLVGRTAVAVDTKRGAASGTPWTQESLLAVAEQVCTKQERELVTRLLQHRESKAGRFSWGTGATPGVTGWYIVDGRETPVWNYNLGKAPGKGTLYFIFGEYSARQPASRVASYAEAVGGITALADKVDKVRKNNWKGWVGLSLSEAAKVPDDIVGAVDVALS